MPENRRRGGGDGHRAGNDRRPNNRRDQQRPGSGRQQQAQSQNQQQGQRKESEKKPFVPWLGEERPGKGPILDLEQYRGKPISIQFSGGRAIEGILVGFDALLNLVLDDVKEDLDNEQVRNLGKLVARGPQIQTISPVLGSGDIGSA